jgi:hypothetical protein
MACVVPVYRPRDAVHTVLHQVIGEHLEAFLCAAAAAGDGAGLPQFVEREFRDFLPCGVFEAGVARFRCEGRARRARAEDGVARWDARAGVRAAGVPGAPGGDDAAAGDELADLPGVLAPRARWRERVVAYGRVAPVPTGSAAPMVPGPDGTAKPSPPCGWSWAALMHRAFAVDVLACPHCGGRLRLIATLHGPAVIRKILEHLGRAPSGPSPGPAPPASRRRRALS